MRFARTLVCAALVTLLPTAVLAQAPAKPPIERFFGNPSFTAAVLSPSGKYLAVKISLDGGRERLAVVDVLSGKVNVAAYFADADVNHFRWLSDERLVLDTRDRTVAAGDVHYGPGLWAVNRDGSKLRQLVKLTGSWLDDSESAKLLPWHTFLLQDQPPSGNEYVYVVSGVIALDHFSRFDLIKLNTLSGRTISMEAPGDVLHWVLDAAGEPRIAFGRDKNVETVWYRDPAQDNKWRVLRTYDPYHDDFDPVGLSGNGTLYVSAYGKSDKLGLYKVNMATGQLDGEPLVSIRDFDFSGDLINAKGKLAGVEYLGDAPSTVWLDPAMKKVQDEVDALLPATSNTVRFADTPQTPWVLVIASSDVQPPIYALYNTETKKFNKVGEARPGLDPATMAHRDLVKIKARDGLEIPAWLSLPASGGKKRPMVVWLHGGPWVRGASWEWDPQIQFLASRGYVVLEPEFRGSTGYGHELFMKGLKQWGLSMQDDVADAARWAIAQGIADPQRICIAGASYGGYATLMGLAKDGDLFKCGIDIAGPTDINLMYSGTWFSSDDVSADAKKYSMPERIGDPKADAEQLKATSPIEQAARIKRPLLMAYGGSDRRVPTYHGKRFLEAVSKTNPNVEYVVYDGEGHGLVLPKNRIDLWTRIEKFLDQQIGH